MKDVLDRWGQTGEFRDVPTDEFLEVMLAAQKDRSTSDAALFLCWLRYNKSNPPPADMIKVLLEAPIDGWSGRLPHWDHITLLYLDKHKISAKQGSVLLLKAARAICLLAMFDKLSGNLSRDVWLSLVLAVMDAKGGDLLAIRQGLRECRGHFDAESVEYMYGLVKTRTPKKLAPLIAAVLPDDLSVVTQWMSLCEGQKTDVAVRLHDNMMSYMGPPVGIDYWQARLDAVPAVRQEATELLKSWLDLYQASLHYKIGQMLWSSGNETFKIGFVETATEKEKLDNLEAWLEDPDILVVGKDKLLHNVRTDREPWGRRKDGHIWHAKLTRALYESRKFKSVEVEYEMSGRDSRGDIRLEDEHGSDIHIEAWDGMTEATHSMTRMIQTGKRFDINRLGQHDNEDDVFGWKHANRWLNSKVVKQLPSTGRNFVVAQHPQHELIWQSMEGVDLKDNTCAIQIVPPKAHVWYKNRECMGATARLVSESLGLEYYPIDGGR